MSASQFEFVDAVAAQRDLVVTNAQDHVRRIEPRHSTLAWYCDLDDGTPTGESDPAAFVRWVCPALRTGIPATASVPELDVHQLGPQSDLGKLFQKFSLFTGRAPEADSSERYLYTDPAGILDAGLRRRIENWPPALHGDGVVRPAELWSIRRTREGLIVESVSWWGSAQALDHQLALAVELAHRLLAPR